MGQLRYIGIVEDDKAAMQTLKDYLLRYSKENGKAFETTCFHNANSYTVNQSTFDIIFMDIELPDGNGMQLVKKLRETDKSTMVIFITNLVQYAVKGYEVRAFDFIVKPISYYNFSLKLQNALESLEQNKSKDIWIKEHDVRRQLFTSDIKYVDILSHYITYHTVNGDYTVFGSLLNVQKELADSPFALCNRCYFVNLKYVSEVRQNSIIVGGTELQMSRQKRKDFLRALNEFYAQGGTPD